MTIKFGKTEVTKIAKVLERTDFEDENDAARAVLEAALEVLEARGKFTVVGQLNYSPKGGWITKDDATVSKVCLGLFSTAGDASAAARSLTYSTQTGEEFKVWVLDVEHASATDVYRKRKEAHHAADIAARKEIKLVPEEERAR